MPDHDTFLRTIAASPSDDGPRLVYADWLEEQGAADRAEFIRLQIELVRTENDDDPMRRAKERRADALLAAHWWEWLAPVCEALGDPAPMRPGAPPPSPTRRGFADRLMQRVLGAIVPGPPPPRPDDYKLWGTVVLLNRTGPTSMSQRNFRAAEFKRGFPDTLYLFAWPELNGDILQRLTSRCPLADLHLHGPVDPWERLDGPHLHSLPSLTVSPLGPVGAAFQPVLERLFTAIGESPHLSRLTQLSTEVLLGEGAVVAIARSPLLSRLRRLIFAGETPAMLAVADHAEYGRLERLGLLWYSATVGAVHRFAGSPAAAGSRDLSLSVNDENDVSLVVSALTEPPHSDRLESLTFETTAVSDRLVTALVGRATFANLTRLGLPRDIVATLLTRDGIAALAASAALPVLRELDLMGHGLSAAALAPLFSGTRLLNLRRLDLSENNVGDDGAAALPAGSLAPQLRHLSLRSNAIGPTGALTLARASSLDRVHSLDLRGNNIGPDARRALLDRFGDRVIV